MTFDELIDLSRAYARLDWAVTAQFTVILDGEALADQNPNALRDIRSYLRKVEQAGIEGASDEARDWREAIDEHLESLG